MQQGETEGNLRVRGGPSLRLILGILLVAIITAIALAYLVVTPFFHQHPQ